MKSLQMTFALFVIAGVVCAQDSDSTAETKDGRQIYESWCARCHGADGSGKVEGLVLDNPAPDFTDCYFNSRETRKDWKAVILDGGPARGLSMTMPAWKEALSGEQAEAIVAHLKSFCTDPAWPPGELNFRRAIITEKAFPEDEALLIPTYTQQRGVREAQYEFLLEQRLGARLQWEISVPALQRFGRGAAALGDIEVSGKYAIAYSLEDLTIFSAGLEAALPTGQRTDAFGGGAWKVSPFLAAGKGFGNLTLQSSVVLEKPLRTGLETELQYNVAATIALSNDNTGLFPALELNGTRLLGESGYSVFLTPQVYVGLVSRGHLGLSVGAQIPVAGERPFQYRLMAFFLWEYLDGGLWW